jgi:hypothetical protein
VGYLCGVLHEGGGGLAEGSGNTIQVWSDLLRKVADSTICSGLAEEVCEVWQRGMAQGRQPSIPDDLHIHNTSCQR